MNVSKTPATKTAAAAQAAVAPTESPTPVVISPTVGRRVYFWPNEEDQSRLSVFDAQQPCDAGVIYVWDDRRVNLDVTGPSGVRHTMQNVRLLQGDEQPAEGESYAAWMTYQIKKAAEEAAA